MLGWHRRLLEDPLESIAKLHGRKWGHWVSGLVDSAPGVVDDRARATIPLGDYSSRG
jgi:hypothetical protein